MCVRVCVSECVCVCVCVCIQGALTVLRKTCLLDVHVTTYSYTVHASDSVWLRLEG